MMHLAIVLTCTFGCTMANADNIRGVFVEIATNFDGTYVQFVSLMGGLIIGLSKCRYSKYIIQTAIPDSDTSLY